MQIILVSRHLKTARTITIMPRHLLAVLAVAAALVFSTSALFSWLSVHLRLPMVENLLVSLYGQESRKTQDYVSNNLNLMAGRLGELQAKVLQLDQLSERLSLLAGQREPVKTAQERPGQGGGVHGGLHQDFALAQVNKPLTVVEYDVDGGGGVQGDT